MPKGSTVPNRGRVRISFGKAIAVEQEADPAARRGEAVRLSSELRGAVEGMLAAG